MLCFNILPALKDISMREMCFVPVCTQCALFTASLMHDNQCRQYQENSWHHSARNVLSSLLHKSSELNGKNFNYSVYFIMDVQLCLPF
jgi:hypothetical protein